MSKTVETVRSPDGNLTTRRDSHGRVSQTRWNDGRGNHIQRDYDYSKTNFGYGNPEVTTTKWKD